MDEMIQILQWLRDGDEHIAAKILEECSLNLLYVDTLFELGGEREFEMIDIDIQAPRKIITELGASLHQQADQIETAIRECCQSTGFYIRNINWVPKLITEINPAVDQITVYLANIDSEHVHKAWKKALERKNNDPEGAITAARTLVEAVCKHILDKEKIPYPDDADLPKLYYLTAEYLKLAPNQQSEKIFRQILGNTQAVISGLAYMRNELGDAHGKRSDEIKPNTIHAELAVNLAGTLATFVVSTWEKFQEEQK